MQSVIDQLPENWQTELERRLLEMQQNRCVKRGYIASPCRAATTAELRQNMEAARFYMYYAMRHLQLNAVAPHAYVPALLNDGQPAERAQALRFGQRLLEFSDELHVCGGTLTCGMLQEAEHAILLRLPVTVYHPELCLELKKLATRCGAEKKLVRYDERHPLLSCTSRELFTPALERRYA